MANMFKYHRKLAIMSHCVRHNAIGSSPMKIDIGNGKVLGTKRVSSNGQISGFTEFACQDVLVVLPGNASDVKLGAMDPVK